MPYSCNFCPRTFTSKKWFDKHCNNCGTRDDLEIPSISKMYEMICSMKKEIASLKKIIGQKELPQPAAKLQAIDIYFEDWAKQIIVYRNDIYGIIEAGYVQGIINILWHNIDSIETSPICLYNNTVMVYSKNGWRPINKSLLSIATQNILSQIPSVFNKHCPELSDVNSINFDYDAYIKNIEILLRSAPSIECFMKCILKNDCT